MKLATRIGIVLTAVGMTIGLLGAPAEASRDSGWGCPGCIAPANR